MPPDSQHWRWRLARGLEPLWGETWNIGCARPPRPGAAADRVRAVLDPVWLFPADRSRSYADPWVAADGDRTWLFCEVYDRGRGHGAIGCCELAADGSGWRAGPLRIVLSGRHHLSYPCLFRHRDRWCMVPEAAESGAVRLFRATRFPWQWQEEAVLLPGYPGLDPTVHRDEAGWWLFSTRLDSSENCSLHLHHAPRLDGPWTEVGGRPVKRDAGSVRPAGPLFRQDGLLLRPAQDCRGTYGRMLVLNRVDALTPAGFAETPVLRLVPAADGPYPAGMHSWAPLPDGRILVDAKRFTGLKARLARPLVARRLRAERRREVPRGR